MHRRHNFPLFFTHPMTCCCRYRVFYTRNSLVPVHFQSTKRSHLYHPAVASSIHPKKSAPNQTGRKKEQVAEGDVLSAFDLSRTRSSPSGSRFPLPSFSWLASFPPSTSQILAHPSSPISQVLCCHLTPRRHWLSLREVVISELNSPPVFSSVNASPRPRGSSRHGSGPIWPATPLS